MDITIFWSWVFGSCFINFFGLLFHIKINYYKGKWDRNKKSPIYKIEKSGWVYDYTIYKYEIDYDCYHFINDSAFLIIISVLFLPFSCWFRFPYYKRGDLGYGEFDQENIPNIDFDLGEFWEFKNNKSMDEYYKEIEKENKEKEILNNLNKDFNKHYNNE
jgi:hypothetical protein